MKKVMIPVSGGNMPPLIMVGATQPKKPVATNSVQPIVLKTISSATSLPKLNSQPVVLQMNSSKSDKASNMCLVQTTTGKKLLLTNVVNVSKTSTRKQVLLVPQKNSQAIISSSSSTAPAKISSVVPSTPHRIVLQPTSLTTSSGGPLPTSQPIVVKVGGLSPLGFKQDYQSPIVSIKQEPSKVEPQIITVISNSTAKPATISTATKPITSISNSNPIMILNGTTTFKVVGKPVPVKLSPRFQKIAPKKHFITGALPQVSLPPLNKIDTSLNSQSSAPAKNIVSSKPPAYLNIRVKEEPQDSLASETITVDGVCIKEEKEDIDTEKDKTLQETLKPSSEDDSKLEFGIKEEFEDDEGDLLAQDEELRQVLGVTEGVSACPQPKFYIRTSEGKLVCISPEEAEALGLDHKDKVENNQKKLMKALTSVKSLALQKTHGQDDSLGKPKPEPIALIPENVNVKDYVNYHVTAAAEKTAAFMKNIGFQRVETNTKCMITPKSNTTIIGEYTDSERRYLRIHIESEAQERDVCDIPITPLNGYQCPFCTRDFKTKDHIISHIRVHTGERPYPCDVCGKRYRQRIDIIRHMRIHTGEKPFTCGLCNASFNQKSNLRSHMRIHTGERPVQCRVCGKGFSRNTHLKQHMKLHTGEKPFQCSVCYRPFRFKSGLQAHERIHSGLKPYACSLCGRTFTQIVGLIRHERTHTGEKPFRCQSCGKSFDNRENLKAHVRKHTSERPYPCDICEKKFTDQSALRCHRKKYHTNLLLCVICLREDFKDRIELREHLRAHERENWQETPDGDLVPIVRRGNTQHIVSIDDTMDNLIKSDEEDKSINGIMSSQDGAEEIQVEVELDPDDPMESDENMQDDDEDDEEESEYEEHELQIEELDPLA
ncbi:uncharacterized protein [Procambarus clarkii]|uniref:uncharacterized protein n=1 Tax=Procambarus clarkii TaxID=6728 RepID=UPI001E673CA7|nr:zinc finger protein 37-like [Procambarus clarkii]